MNFCPGTKQVSLVQQFSFYGDIFPLSEIEFEGHMLRAPGNIDRYLRRIYGDWTQLPDLNRLKAHTAL